MSKKLVEEIIWEQLAPILEGLAPIDAELLVEGIEDITPEAIEKAIKAFDINQKDFEKALESGAVEDDVRLFREYAEKIEGNTVEDKIKNLALFLELDEEFRARILVDEPPDPEEAKKQKDPLTGIRDISKIISKIIYIKTITRILSKFDATTAGTLMEPLFASLGGQKGVSKGGKGTLVDFQIGEKLYGLKTVEQGDIEGSYSLLKKILLEGKEIKYIVALKSLLSDESGEITLEFREFTLDKSNFVKLMTTNRDTGTEFTFSETTSPEPDLSGGEIIGDTRLQRFAYELKYSLGSDQLSRKIGDLTFFELIKSLLISGALARRFGYDPGNDVFKGKILALIPNNREEAKKAIKKFFEDKELTNTIGDTVLGKLLGNSIMPDDKILTSLKNFFKDLTIDNKEKKYYLDKDGNEIKIDKNDEDKTTRALRNKGIFRYKKSLIVTTKEKEKVEWDNFNSERRTGTAAKSAFTQGFNNLMKEKINLRGNLTQLSIQTIYKAFDAARELDSIASFEGASIAPPQFRTLMDLGPPDSWKTAAGFETGIRQLKEYFENMSENGDEYKFFKFFSVIMNLKSKAGRGSYERTTASIFDNITKGKNIQENKSTKKRKSTQENESTQELLDILGDPNHKRFREVLLRSDWKTANLLSSGGFAQHSRPIVRVQLDTKKIVGVLKQLIVGKRTILSKNLKRYGYIQQQYQEMAINLSKFYNSGMKINEHAESSKNNATEIINTIGTE